MRYYCSVTLLFFIVVSCNNGQQQQNQERKDRTDGDSVSATKTISNALMPSDSFYFNAFKQGLVKDGKFYKIFHWGAGNCASLAAIKCAISTFGVGKVFRKVDTLQDSYKVHLFNGDSVVIYKSYLSTLVPYRVGWYLYTDDSASRAALNYAYLCFSVMAVENDEKGRWRFPRQVDELDKGYDASSVYELLGLKSMPVNMADIYHARNVVVYNSCHCVYSSMGFFDEEDTSSRGKYCISPVDSFPVWHTRTKNSDPISGAYTLRQ